MLIIEDLLGRIEATNDRLTREVGHGGSDGSAENDDDDDDSEDNDSSGLSTLYR